MGKKNRVTILGDGGWGTALALVNVRKRNETLLWSAFSNYAEELQQKRENVKFLPGIPLPKELIITSDLRKAIEFGDIIILAIPTQYIRNVLYTLQKTDVSKKIFISVAKGIEKKTGLRPSGIVHSVLGTKTRVVALSGPSHAEEVAKGIPTLLVAASPVQRDAFSAQETLMDTYFRIYVQSDVVGVELAGALKNVIAIAAGICDGLGYGTNTKSGLLSRGLVEMTRLGAKLGANPTTFFGLAGVGDLITTCFSPHGRNLRVGRAIGEGKKISEITKSMEMVAEGVDTSKSVVGIAKRVRVTVPIMEQVHAILFEKKDPRKSVLDLLQRSAFEEWRHVSS